jgi:hypothetical protein
MLTERRIKMSAFDALFMAGGTRHRGLVMRSILAAEEARDFREREVAALETIALKADRAASAPSESQKAEG